MKGSMRYLGWRSVIWPVATAYGLGMLTVAWPEGWPALVVLGGALGWVLSAYPDREP